MTKYIRRVTRLTVLPEGKSIFAREATYISIEDDGVGEFIKVAQSEVGHILIDPMEWATLREAIDEMHKECRQEEASEN